MSSLQYVRNLIKDFNVASIAPTSTFGINKIFKCMDFEKADTVVEYGPGGGVITRALLKKMRPGTKLIAIETNPDFADHIESSFDDPRLCLYRDSAENVLDILAAEGRKTANYIISGIPFSIFPIDKKDRILTATKDALGDDGSFLVYQFLVSASGPKHDIKSKLNQHMHIVRSDYEMLNIPPIRIYHAVNGTLARELKQQKNSR